VHMCSIIVRYFQNGFLSINYVHNQFQKHSVVHFQGIAKKVFFENVFVKICRKMRFISINYVRNRFKTFSCSFSKYCNDFLKKCFQNMFVKNTLRYGLDSLGYHIVSFDMLWHFLSLYDSVFKFQAI
jgi:hypothetical protein